MSEDVLGQLASLRTASTTALRQQWKQLFGREAPPYNRKFLEHRLAYRIQELAFGGLSPRTVKRLDALAREIDDALAGRKRPRAQGPAPGTRLIREWQGQEHVVMVTQDGFVFEGRPYRSLSAIARAITGTRWNGPLFFGLRQAGSER